MHVIEIRKDVWLESLAADGGWEGIEADLPETADAPLVLLVQTKGERLIRGIFHRTNLINPVLRQTAIGLSEIDPVWFKRYIERKSPHNVIDIVITGDTRVKGMQPSSITIYDPNKDQETEKDTTLKIGTLLEDKLVGLVADTLEHLEPPLLIIRNTNRLDLEPLYQYLEQKTTYLVDSRTYTLKGE